jgi:YD repeat-containing protein
VESGTGATTSAAVSQVDTQYAPCACSPLGKMYRVSQPYAPGGTPVWTTYTYDGSGRTLTVTAPGGSVTTTAYLTSFGGLTGNFTQVTDPAGKWKVQQTDAMGNLITMFESNPAGGANWATNYGYNGANQLISVTMPRSNGTQTRSFAYAGSDLISTTNPENGQVTYQYDGAHHVTLRTDAKGQQTRYIYDGYSRLTQVQHWVPVTTVVNGQSFTQLQEDPKQRVTYTYDANAIDANFSQNAMGRLTAVQFADENAGYPYSYMYSYNQAGRVTAQHLDYNSQVDFDATYTWDTEGRMTGTSYGQSGANGAPAYTMYSTSPSYTMQYDGMGRLSGMQQGGTSVASATYGVAGEMLGLNYFGVSEGRTYNTLLQMTRQTVPGMMDMQYIYTAGSR